MTNNIEVQIVEGLVIRPGDTLVIKVQDYDEETATSVRDAVLEEMPENVNVLIISGEVELTRVTGEDDDSIES